MSNNFFELKPSDFYSLSNWRTSATENVSDITWGALFKPQRFPISTFALKGLSIPPLHHPSLHLKDPIGLKIYTHHFVFHHVIISEGVMKSEPWRQTTIICCCSSLFKRELSEMQYNSPTPVNRLLWILTSSNISWESRWTVYLPVTLGLWLYVCGC